ncbi:hypothetical protein [Zhenhengia yiwuensis]|uniref:Uncharacterized protein n=1 Tax=Zhenhengia yiwuensis TaxID=2763666 RepID=A0A926I9U3_9FIRM|nr:hypothetical protein [Zhenhengia yiwuensis]MBC8580145.1 hypothetical protein [Zhenhengia yiwuensis]
MNTLGMLRGYMAKNMDATRFIDEVTKTLSKEFNELVRVKMIKPGVYRIELKDYKITMSEDLINKLKSPYRVDRYILLKFEEQGFKFDRNRSQYIMYCFGNYIGATISSK